MSEAPKKIPSPAYEELRIKIAELRGWTKCKPRASVLDYPWISGINPNPDKILVVVPTDGFSPPRHAVPSDYGFETLPDYFGDVNVIQQAVLSQVGTAGFVEKYNSNLMQIIQQDQRRHIESAHLIFWVANATAAQRAHAFYETIKP